MTDSSWGAPPQSGYWGPTEGGPVQGAAPAGPTYDAHDAQHTRPMPIVPDDVPPYGGDQDDDRGAARLSGPLFRNDTPSAQPLSHAAAARWWLFSANSSCSSREISKRSARISAPSPSATVHCSGIFGLTMRQPSVVE